MSHLKYYAYEGVGVRNREMVSLPTHLDKRASSTLHLPRGWHDDGTFETEINAQIDCAFANVEKNLKDAGGKGWSQVFRVDSYHVPLDDEAPAAMIRNLAKYMPDHQPIWTCVGVPRLGEEAMKVEIAVVAHDPEGAKTA
ncbi:endoribonuclease L-psp family protein [Verticillium dahliae]|nr:endoribonuclease L-psp family protein [Verticillium dahliae]